MNLDVRRIHLDSDTKTKEAGAAARDEMRNRGIGT